MPRGSQESQFSCISTAIAYITEGVKGQHHQVVSANKGLMAVVYIPLQYQHLLNTFANEESRTWSNRSEWKLSPKKDGDQRLVINLKHLNELKSEHFKMEGLHTVKAVLRRSNWMAKVDLKDALFMVPIAPSISSPPTLQVREEDIPIQLSSLWSMDRSLQRFSSHQ